MDNKFEKLVASMREKRTDDLFDPSELDSLNEVDRRKVEYEIVFNVLYGNPDFFKYIPHLTTFDVQGIKSKMDYKSLSDASIIELDSQIYRATNNIEDLNRIIPMAMDNQQAFYSLAKIYTYNKEKQLDNNNEQLLPVIKKCLDNSNDKNYEAIFSNEVFKSK